MFGKYKVGEEIRLSNVEGTEECIFTIVEVTTDSVVVEDDDGRQVTLGAPPPLH